MHVTCSRSICLLLRGRDRDYDPDPDFANLAERRMSLLYSKLYSTRPLHSFLPLPPSLT